MVVEPGEKDPTGLQGLTRKMALLVKMTQTITTTQQFINLSTQKNYFSSSTCKFSSQELIFSNLT